MALDPQLAELLKMMHEADLPPMEQGTPTAARVQLRQNTVDARTPDMIVPVADVDNRTLPGGAGELPARVYWPEDQGTFPIIVFFHGGGWVIGDLDTHDNMARQICRGCHAIVVSVDYRLAPEQPFPAAVEDAISASYWVAAHQSELGGDGRVAVAGESAGGNLAAVVAQSLRQNGTVLSGQLLLYPATDLSGSYPSRDEFGSGYFLEPSTMAWFEKCYLGTWSDRRDPLLSPIYAHDLTGLAPALVVTAECDSLRDEGEAYGKALQEAGVTAKVQRCEGMIHGFFDMGAMSDAAQVAIDVNCENFRQIIHR